MLSCIYKQEQTIKTKTTHMQERKRKQSTNLCVIHDCSAIMIALQLALVFESGSAAKRQLQL
jgi:hypothetical protein